MIPRFVKWTIPALFVSTALAQQAGSPTAWEARANTALGLTDSQVLSIVTQAGSDGLTRAAIEIAGQPVVFELAPASVRASDFRLFVQLADGSFQNVQPDPVQTLRGELLGAPGSQVAATVNEEGLTARILLADGAEYWVEPLARHVAGATPDLHAVYATTAVIDNGGQCATDALPNAVQTPAFFSQGGQVQYAGAGTQIAELGCDADYEYFLDYGSAGAVQSRIDTVINTMNLQYENEVGICHTITTTLVRTSASQPYTSTDAVTLLNQFRNEWNANQGGIQRDVAQLFTGKEINGGTIGIAWVGAVCSSYGYGVVQSDFNNNFSCATDLSAHELGHNWNAQHCSCTSNTMNPYITCANTFHPSFTIPTITSFRDSINCLDGGGGPGGGDPTSVHVASIVPSTVKLSKGRKRARATVTIEDDLGNPVSGATVNGTFTGGINESLSGTTNSNGQVTLTTLGSKKGKLNFTFCVDSVSAALPYAPGDNAETCDSN